MLKLKEITDRSWLLIVDQDKIGLISQQNNGEYILLAKEARIRFENRSEVNRFFEEDVFGNIEIVKKKEDDTQHFIKGYPVNYPNPIEPDNIKSDLPVFIKRKNSKVHLCAGYFCIGSPVGWRTVFCPKLSTIEQYPYRGPFRTDLEMKQQLKQLKKEHRDGK